MKLHQLVPGAVNAVGIEATTVLAQPAVRADIEQRRPTVSPNKTLAQEQDDYLKEIQIYTANSRSIGLTQQ